MIMDPNGGENLLYCKSLYAKIASQFYYLLNAYIIMHFIVCEGGD